MAFIEEMDEHMQLCDYSRVQSMTSEFYFHARLTEECRNVFRREQ